MLFLPTPNRIEEVYEERVTSFTFNARLFPVEAMACSGAEKLLALKNAELFPAFKKKEAFQLIFKNVISK